MPQTCTICRHSDRPAIEQALVNGKSLRDIARHYFVSKDALARHKADHLPRGIAEAHRVEGQNYRIDVARDLYILEKVALDMLASAHTAGDTDLTLKAMGHARRNIELAAKMQGELDESTKVNILLNPQFQAIQAMLIEVLGPYPDLRATVAQRLAQLEEPNDDSL